MKTIYIVYIVFLSVLSMWFDSAYAQIFIKCYAADGKISYSNFNCPNGSKEKSINIVKNVAAEQLNKDKKLAPVVADAELFLRQDRTGIYIRSTDSEQCKQVKLDTIKYKTRRHLEKEYLADERILSDIYNRSGTLKCDF